jgi:shikimate dehydrogenase
MSHQIKAALIGHGIAGSLTPAMHEAEGRALGLEYSYERIDTIALEYAGEPLGALLQMAEDRGFAGVNITHPFKREAAALADSLSPTAAELGAVNTICFLDGRRIGHNTDYIGFRSALRAGENIAPLTRLILLGAGGAGGAVALALLDQGCEVLTICDPAQERAARLAAQMQTLRPSKQVTGVNALEHVALDQIDGAVNATPLGMEGHGGRAIDPALLPPQAWIGDIVYFPLETELLRSAQARGMRTLDGGGMAVFQAVAAFSLITGRRPDAERMHAHFAQLTRRAKSPQEEMRA